MHLLAEQLVLDPFALVALLAIAACAGTWVWMAAQWQRGRSIVPYQSRRIAPWGVIDLVLVLAFYLSLQSLMVGMIGEVFGRDATEAALTRDSSQVTTEHVVGQLLAKGDPWFLLLCGVSAVIVAPAVEEFFFRVLLQGWLEVLELRWRRRLRMRPARMLRGVVPIVLTALIFASMHFRLGEPEMNIRYLVIQQAIIIFSGLLTLAFAVGLLRWHGGATAEDMGWTPGKTAQDVKLGLRVFLAIAAPLFAMQIGLRLVLPENIAPDPIPLFFFALALGILYYRTHRIAPVFTLHAALNGTSLAMAWLGG